MPTRLSAALLTAVMAAGCGAPPAADEILIGATLPLTGKESRAGLYFKNGYTLAVDEANGYYSVRVVDEIKGRSSDG